MKKFMTLKLRITLLLGTVMILMAVVLTAVSIKSANRLFLKSDAMKVAMIKLVENPIELEKQPENIKATIISEASKATTAAIMPLEIIHMPTESMPVQDVAIATSVIQAQQSFSSSSILIMAGIIIIALILTYFMVGQALAPLTRLSEAIKKIDENNLNKMDEIPQAEDEVGSLTKSFNNMLKRLGVSFENQRRFAANAAHELKTPLATMKTTLQVLKMDDEPTSEDIKETIDCAEKSVDRLTEVVNGLLLLSSNAQMSFNDQFSIRELMENCINELKNQINDKEIKIDLFKDDEIILGNATLIQNVFKNVLENAIKYNRKSGIIKIEMKKELKDIKLIFSDTGIGMSKDEVERIFEPFFRADESRSQEVPGHGLGMSLVKAIIEKHGGNIAVQSSPGYGSIVSIILPQSLL